MDFREEVNSQMQNPQGSFSCVISHPFQGCCRDLGLVAGLTGFSECRCHCEGQLASVLSSALLLAMCSRSSSQSL